MNKDKRNIDLLFEEKLKQFRESPPAHTWDRLEKDLNREKSVKLLFYLRLAAASLLILLAFGAGYFYATYQSEPSQKISQELLLPQIESDSKHSEKPIDLNNELVNKEETQSAHQNYEETLRSILPSKKQDKVDQPIATNNEKKTSDILIAENEVQDVKTLEDITEKPEAIVEENIDTQNAGTEETITLKQDEPSKNDVIPDYKPLVLDPNAKAYGMETAKNNEKKWSVGAQVAPVWSYRDISINYQNQSGSNAKEAESQLNDTEDALLSYAGGIDVNYNLSNRWIIQSGMYYSKIGQVNNNALDFRQDNDQYFLFAIRTSTGSIDVAFERIPDDIRKINPPKDTLEAIDLNNVKIIQNFDLFEIPLMIKYKILDKKLGINISGGLSPAYLLNNNTILQVDEDKYDIGNSSNLNNMIFNTSISLGLNYALSKKLSLKMEPNFKYSLSPINKNSQFDYHPYYFSWFTGLSYKF
jgi:hypothetical protein